MFLFPEGGNNKLEMQDEGGGKEDLKMATLETPPVAHDNFFGGGGSLMCFLCTWAPYDVAVNSTNCSTQTFTFRPSLPYLQP